MFDLAEGTPLGSTAIALTIAGTVAGLLALVAADPQWWLGAIFVALGTAAGVVMVPLVRLFIGETHPFTADLIVVVPVAVGGRGDHESRCSFRSPDGVCASSSPSGSNRSPKHSI